MDRETIDQISSYLRGLKLPRRADDPRLWADELDRDVAPYLDELAKLKAKKSSKNEAVSA